LKIAGSSERPPLIENESAWLLHQAVGKVKRVNGFDLLGHAMVNVKVGGRLSGTHAIAVESARVRKVEVRSENLPVKQAKVQGKSHG